MDNRQKLTYLQQLKINPYPEKSYKDLANSEFLTVFNKLLKSQKKIWLAGRIVGLRTHGKISFIDLQDFESKVQIVLQRGKTENYALVEKTLDLGDFLSVKGTAFLPQAKQKSLLATAWLLLSKAHRNFPKEYYKVRDEELLTRAPYLETIFYEEARAVFNLRFKIIQLLRQTLWREGFVEVETPILQTHYGGAFAKPFTTHLDALNRDLFLRIAPELYLKKMLVGGFEKIFEIGKNFRNEGIDREHNPEFTVLELYWAYQNREGLMNFTQQLLQKLLADLRRPASPKLAQGKAPRAAHIGQTSPYGLGLTRKNLIEFQGKRINFSSKTWPSVKFVDLIKKETGLDYFKNTLKDFIQYAKKIGLGFNPKVMSKGKLADEIFKTIRPKLVQPIFLIDHPKEISPLAKTNSEDERLALRFQLYIAGLEIANAWAELNDPVEEEARFKEQAKLLKLGDIEAHPYDETFIEALEYGMPPTAGLGIGIDRLIMLLANQPSLKKVIYFPFVRD